MIKGCLHKQRAENQELVFKGPGFRTDGDWSPSLRGVTRDKEAQRGTGEDSDATAGLL